MCGCSRLFAMEHERLHPPPVDFAMAMAHERLHPPPVNDFNHKMSHERLHPPPIRVVNQALFIQGPCHYHQGYTSRQHYPALNGSSLKPGALS